MIKLNKQEGRIRTAKILGGIMGDTEEELIRLRVQLDVTPEPQDRLPSIAALRALGAENIEGKNDVKLNLKRDWPLNVEYTATFGGRSVTFYGDVALTPRVSLVRDVGSLRWTVETDVPCELVADLLYMVGQDGVQLAVDPPQQELDLVEPKKRAAS